MAESDRPVEIGKILVHETVIPYEYAIDQSGGWRWKNRPYSLDDGWFERKKSVFGPYFAEPEFPVRNITQYSPWGFEFISRLEDWFFEIHFTSQKQAVLGWDLCEYPTGVELYGNPLLSFLSASDIDYGAGKSGTALDTVQSYLLSILNAMEL